MMNEQQAELRRLRAEIDRKLDEKPSKYEVRYLIVLAIIAGQVLPTVDVAKAAGAAVLGVWP